MASFPILPFGAVAAAQKSTTIGVMDALFTTSSNIASASTTDLSTATGLYVNITGTTTITAFGTSPNGALRFLKFAGILTLTYNATSLIVPTAASIITAAGDTAIVISEGSGNWRVVDYIRASGQALASSGGVSGPIFEVDVVSTSNIAGSYSNGTAGVGATFTFTATGSQSLNSVSLSLTGGANGIPARILLTSQTSGLQNGWYDVTTNGSVGVSVVLTRDTSMDSSAKYVSQNFIVGSGDSTNGGNIYRCTNTSAPTVGTTAITFAQFSTSNVGAVALSPAVTQTILSTATNATGLAIKKLTSQSVNLLNIQDTNGNSFGGFLNNGTLQCQTIQLLNGSGGVVAGFAATLNGVTLGTSSFIGWNVNGGLAGSSRTSLYEVSSGVVGVGTGAASGIADFKLRHLIGGSSIPTIAANTGAGSAPTVAMSTNSTDLAGEISITTGTVTPGANDVVTITFNAAYGTAPWVVFSPSNVNAALLSGTSMVYVGGSTTTTFKISVGSAGLISATAYKWTYTVNQ